MRKELSLSVAFAAIIASSQAHATDNGASAAQSKSGTDTVAASQANATDKSSSEGSARSSPEAAAASQVSTSGLSDIVVTAQRKTESSQKAAIAINVVGGADLLRSGVSTSSALTALVPALTVNSTGSFNFFFVRGVGNFSVTSSSDPAVAFNYDGIYVGRPTSAAGVYYDLDRVEVLKGPQGTLYGRNATGGAINVLPTQPKEGELSGYGSVSYGNYNSFNVQGAINAPLGDNGAIRVSGNVVGHDAYLYAGADTERTQAFRVQLKSSLTPSLTVRTDFDYAHVGGTGAVYSLVDHFAYNPALTTLPLGQQFTVTPTGIDIGQGAFSAASQAYRQTLPAGGPDSTPLNALTPLPYQNNRYYGANSTVDLDTGIGRFTVIPAWRYSRLDVLGGNGFYVLDQEKAEQYSVEARLGKTGVGILDYNVGLYYYSENIQAHTTVEQAALDSQQDFTTSTKSYAAFGRLTAHLTDRFRLVGAGRYTDDNKNFNGKSIALTINCNFHVAAGCLSPTNPLFSVQENLADLPFPIPAANGATVPYNGYASPAINISRADETVSGSYKHGKATYRGAAEYDIGPRSLLYASVETGFRSGGFSLASGYETFLPETITAYTIGSKNRFFENRLQVNLEGFYWKYKNEQEPHTTTDLAGNQANFTQNIGSTDIKGGEAEGTFLLTPTTLLGGDVQYLNTRYTSFTYLATAAAGRATPPYTTCNVSAPSGGFFTVDCSGKTAFNSPRWTVNLRVQQTIELDNAKIVVGADTQYRSRRYIGFEYRPDQLVGPDWRTNANISLSDRRDRFTISGYIRNIEGKRTPTYASTASLPGISVVIPSAPRTFGVQVSTKF